MWFYVALGKPRWITRGKKQEARKLRNFQRSFLYAEQGRRALTAAGPCQASIPSRNPVKPKRVSPVGWEDVRRRAASAAATSPGDCPAQYPEHATGAGGAAAVAAAVAAEGAGLNGIPDFGGAGCCSSAVSDSFCQDTCWRTHSGPFKPYRPLSP